MTSFAQLGNDLYTGKVSVPVVRRRRAFYVGSVIMITIALLGLGVRGLNLGLEFRGGSEFRVPVSGSVADYEARAREAVGSDAGITLIGGKTVRVQTSRLSGTESAKVRDALAAEFNVTPATDVSATFIGPSWGASVSQKALQALVIFLLLVALVMGIYFRTWKMSAAALVALAHDMVITVGIYAWTGFEVSPATMIGFLTVLGYSLYDTVVVFDKVRENTEGAFASGRITFADAANLAVNQTMVRSINTTVVALLPIATVLIVGFTTLGPGTLIDLSLVLFIGILVGAYSSIFIATPLLVSLRRNEPKVRDLAERAAKYAARSEPKAAADDAVPVGAVAQVGAAAGGGAARERGEDTTVTGRQIHKYAQAGPRNQPKKAPRSKR